VTTLRRHWWIAGLVGAVLVIVVLGPLASSDPDGLERVGGDLGFIGAAREALFSVIPDYEVPGIDDPNIARVAAGVIGVAVVFLLTVGLGRLLRRRRQT
jgi:cobalt/nickel transport protein